MSSYMPSIPIDPTAVCCARRNVSPRGAARYYEGDLYDPLPATLRGRVRPSPATPPTVPPSAVGLLPPEARMHEPPVALDGCSPDGLDIVRLGLPNRRAVGLAENGRLLVETSAGQARPTMEIFASNWLAPPRGPLGPHGVRRWLSDGVGLRRPAVPLRIG